MQPEGDVVRLRHMLDAAREAVRYASGHTRADLDADRMRAFAMVKAIEIVGEAATKVSATTRAQLQSVAWAEIAGMRNRLIHAYFDIDLNIVLDTVELDLPPLIGALEAYLAARD